MKNALNSLLAILGIFVLTSCGTAKTIVYDPVIIPQHMVSCSVKIFHEKDTIAVSDEARAIFERVLNQKLYGDGLIQNGPDIELHYRFIQYNEGSRLARYALGGIGNGEASLMIEVSYISCDGAELGKIHTEGKISSGVFGGSSNNAVEKAAEEVASHTRYIVLNRQ